MLMPFYVGCSNVTVTDDLSVKVSDYAMFCEEFVGDYHVMADGGRLPLRWMAWESLLMVNSALTVATTLDPKPIFFFL